MTACCASCNTLALGFGVNAAAHVMGLILTSALRMTL